MAEQTECLPTRVPHPVEQRMRDRGKGMAALSLEIGVGLPKLLNVIHGGFPDAEVRRKVAGALEASEKELFPEPPISNELLRGGEMIELSPEAWLKFTGFLPLTPKGEGAFLERVAAGSAALGAFEGRRLDEEIRQLPTRGRRSSNRGIASVAEFPDGQRFLLQRVRSLYHLPDGSRIKGFPAAHAALEAKGAAVRRVARTSRLVDGAVHPEDVAEFFRVYDGFRREMRLYAGQLADWLETQVVRHEAILNRVKGEPVVIATRAEISRDNLRRSIRMLRAGLETEDAADQPDSRGGRSERAGWIPLTRARLREAVLRVRNSSGYMILVERWDRKLFWLRSTDRHGMLRPDGLSRIPMREMLTETLAAKRRAFQVRANTLSRKDIAEIERTGLDAIDVFATTEYGASPGPRLGLEGEARPPRPKWSEYLAETGVALKWTPVWLNED